MQYNILLWKEGTRLYSDNAIIVPLSQFYLVISHVQAATITSW